MTATHQDGYPIHQPVMVSEVLSFLNILSDGVYIDCTVGLGGHASHILTSLSNGRLVGIDRDEEALEYCRSFLPASSPVTLIHHSYAKLPEILAQLKIAQVDGILIDLGLSSFQLNNSDRGFSFRSDGPLDMRFNPETDSLTAAQLISRTSESDLADIIYRYGEERNSRRIARSIKRAPRMETTSDLNEAIRTSTPPAHRHKTQARVYQALRIAVNNELEELETFLNIFPPFLTINGRIVILSFHSLEDRLVKHRFRNLAKEGYGKILTRKPVQPSAEEIENNPRSRSTKLRSLRRIA
ncbi:MAG: 16S rRNA (cytosine(1402)-N(4))-methyltransferase RsmH [Fidelibacterota bacterium]